VPAIARMIMISCVAYAVEDSASEENTARPTALPIAWWGASAVDNGRPNSQVRHTRRGAVSGSRYGWAPMRSGRMNEESI
jgi:hypothetical protein